MLSFHRTAGYLVLTAFLILTGQLYGQYSARRYFLRWSPVKQMKMDGKDVRVLHFYRAAYELNALLPNFYELIKLENNLEYEVELKDPVFQTLDPEDIKNIDGLDDIPESIRIRQSYATLRKQPCIQVSFSPLRRNPRTGQVEVLSEFSLQVTPVSSRKKSTSALQRQYTEQSLLAAGTWIRIRVDQDGIYRLSYEDLAGLGISDPAAVRLYGYGGGMLPLSNQEPRYDDLRENAIYFDKGGDETFGPGDHILFYGRSPHTWDYDEFEKRFLREIHAYSDENYYFLTSDLGPGKTVQTSTDPAGAPGYFTSSYDEHLQHELEDINVIKSGREWYGEHFDIVTDRSFSFSVPGLVTDESIRMKISVIARATQTSIFQVNANQSGLGSISIPGTSFSYSAPYANASTDTFSFNPASPDIIVELKYLKNAPSSEGWLNYINLNVRRNLVYNGEFMDFRDSRTVSPGRVSEFSLDGAGASTVVWDVTDPTNAISVNAETNGETLKFTVATDTLREFVAFDLNGDFPAPVTEGDDVGPVPNQNLHSLRSKNYVVISHPDFIFQARRLAAYRHDHDGLDTVVVTPLQIYNEFSSGTPDATAIRDFLKMLYDRAGTENEMPRYVLLFGDGSYDNKGDEANNTNFIPTYQSYNSISPMASFVTDDFYGLLDDNEGGILGLVDIGIGRLPVSGAEEAAGLVNKVISYDQPDKMGDWRNTVCFIGDDEDGSLHMDQADELAGYVESHYPDFNIGKIYLDAYPQVSTPSGARYPDVNEALNRQIDKGALIINYTGHGGASGLAHERILSINDIVSWNNRDNLPVFITATCEFSRFDDFESSSAGELVLLNPDGGGVALLSTTRLVYAGPNFELNEHFYRYAFEMDAQNGKYRLGDIIRLTKNAASSSINKRNFTLLGDPALELAFPVNQVRVTSVNGTDVSQSVDTLKALGKVTVSGLLEDDRGDLMTGFNGILYPTVYDKSTDITTLSNDGGTAFQFSLRNQVLYKGKATVSNGKFSFSFIVPKDIAYSYGYGKLSFYAAGNQTDAAGAFTRAIVGGTADSIADDRLGPDIRLYMNDENFVFGGMTDADPELLVFISDSNGVNTIGSGIGHDITAILDRNSNQTIVLNDYYEADQDSYRSGKIRYSFRNLDPGQHSLNLKVWDVYNNSSQEELDFVVNTKEGLVLRHVLNYPNPFTTHTAFYFEHNQPDQDLEVIIQIFTVSGKLVRTIERQVPSSGYRTAPIDWDGLDDFGSRIGRGVYIYRVKARTNLGQSAEKFEKLVILR